jgi:hypothetical protein
MDLGEKKRTYTVKPQVIPIPQRPSREREHETVEQPQHQPQHQPVSVPVKGD